MIGLKGIFTHKDPGHFLARENLEELQELANDPFLQEEYKKATKNELTIRMDKTTQIGLFMAGHKQEDIQLCLLASSNGRLAIRRLEELFYSLISPPLNIKESECKTVFDAGTPRSPFISQPKEKQYLTCLDCKRVFKSGSALSEHWVQRHRFRGMTNNDVAKLISGRHNVKND